MTFPMPVPLALSPRQRRQAREFARLLEDPHGARPTGDSELAGLVLVARSLHPAAVAPSEQFRSRLRERLLAEGRTAGQEVARRSGSPGVPGVAGSSRPGQRVRRFAAPAGVMGVLVAACVAVVVASSGALPGDPLYAVKRAAEAVQLSLASSDASRGDALLRSATTRLGEAEELVARSETGSPDTVRHLDVALSGLQSEAGSGSALLLRAYQDDRRPAVLARLSDFLLDTRLRMDALEPRLPSALDGRVQGIDRALDGATQRLAIALQQCGPACASIQVPPTAETGSGTTPGPVAATEGTASSTGTGVGRSTPAPTAAAGSTPGGAAAGATSGGSSAPESTGGAQLGVTAGGDGVDAGVAVPPASAGASVGTDGASVGASLPGGGGASIVVGSSPTVSACVPVPLLHTC